MSLGKSIGQITFTYYVYILTNGNNSVLYTGFTNDLVERCLQHRQKLYPDSFSARYNVNKLVYYETFSDMDQAKAREKQLKAGNRKKKIQLIEDKNPNWLDLFETEIGKDYV